MFALVLKHTSIIVLLSIVASKNHKLDQMDVITAFLNGDLKVDVNMEEPHRFEK